LDVYLVDGTYELFRHFYALPPEMNYAGEEVAATRGVLGSILSILESETRYVGVATDHVIESFRNDLWPGYKTGEGVDPRLLSQFQLLEDSLTSMGLVVWPMIELEADDAMAGAAESLKKFREVKRIYLCSPDKDLAQCIRKDRIVMMDRRRDKIIDEKGVIAKFGVSPDSIPDFLALVGDSADGYPGLEGWGEKSASTVLAKYRHLENIPRESADWTITPRGAEKLARTLRENMKLGLLFRDLATLRTSKPHISRPSQLLWKGVTSSFGKTCERLNAGSLLDRARSLSS
jgi:5'-3' exonuclease